MYWDWATSTYFTPNRHFSPNSGRWISPDPHWNTTNSIFGCEASRGATFREGMPYSNAILQSGNLYVYCMHNPVRFTDSSGLFVIDDAMNRVESGGMGGVGSSGFNKGRVAPARPASSGRRSGASSTGSSSGAPGGGAIAKSFGGTVAATATVKTLQTHGQEIINAIININKRFSTGSDLINPISSIVNSAMYYAKKIEQASAIIRGIAQHAFTDGNKRTAFETLSMLNRELGLNINFATERAWQLIYEIARGDISSVEQISRILQSW